MRAVVQRPVGVFRRHPGHVRPLRADVHRNLIGLVVQPGVDGLERPVVVDSLAVPQLSGRRERLQDASQGVVVVESEVASVDLSPGPMPKTARPPLSSSRVATSRGQRHRVRLIRVGDTGSEQHLIGPLGHRGQRRTGRGCCSDRRRTRCRARLIPPFGIRGDLCESGVRGEFDRDMGPLSECLSDYVLLRVAEQLLAARVVAEVEIADDCGGCSAVAFAGDEVGCGGEFVNDGLNGGFEFAAVAVVFAPPVPRGGEPGPA